MEQVKQGGNLICILGRSLRLLALGWASRVSRRARGTVFRARSEMISGQRRDWGWRTRWLGLKNIYVETRNLVID